ncbi:MAG TPA: hypothetical protein VFR87_10180 [Nocardioidaceae bacterium]|nr:hypothetical protein [Nocardioidaceae bacterium]
MREFAGFDLDGATARAWSGFQVRLADHLAEMGDDDVLVVDVQVAEVDVEGATPYVRLAGFGEGTMLRGEVSSNSCLAAEHRLDAEGEASLVSLGFHEPNAAAGEPEGRASANFFADVPLVEADRLAVMTVQALRDVFGVAHPAFLAAEGLEDDPDVPAPPSEPAIELDEPASVMPESAEHLRELVDRALTPLFGAPPEHDDDGDIPVPWGSSLVYVRVVEEAPVVELFSCVADGVTDLRRAAFEVNVLNRDARFVKFTLVADRVMASIHLPAWPFVPEHLRSMLTGMSAKIDDIDEDLVARVGGTCAIEEATDEPDLDDDEDEEDEELDDDLEGRLECLLEDGRGDDQPGLTAAEAPTGARRDRPGRGELDVALLTLLQLDAETVDSVDPELAASVCGFDKALVVRMLGDTGRQEVAWSQARHRAVALGDRTEAEACEHELRAWGRTTALLRRALRLIVERQLGRTPSASGTAAADPATSGAAASGPAGSGPAGRPGRTMPQGLDVPVDIAETTGTSSTRVARKLFPPRPPRACVVENLDDLTRFHKVDGLAELNTRLCEQSPCTVEVLDLGEHVAVTVDGEAGRLGYPFSLATFQALVQGLEEAALTRVPREVEEA